MVPAVDEEADGIKEGVNTAREAAGLASQAGKVVTEFGIITFDGIGLALVGLGHMDPWIVHEALIDRCRIAIIPTSRGYMVQGTLDNILAKIAPEKEKWLGMIIVGRAITGPSFILPK